MLLSLVLQLLPSLVILSSGRPSARGNCQLANLVELKSINCEVQQSDAHY